MASNTVRELRGAAGSGRARPARRWASGLVLSALGCGSATEPTALPGTGGSSAGTGGTSSTGGAGADDGLPPPSAPACADAPAPFTSVYLPGGPVLDRVGAAPHRVRVLARGFGAPEELTESAADEGGWLRVVELGTGVSDAGADPDGAPWVIVGPHELGELPVANGAGLDLTVESTGNVVLRHWRVVLEQDDQVLLFHQDSNVDPFQLGTFWGFTLARGPAVCATALPSADRRCADVYHHQLDVRVPGGESASLPPGAAQTIGSYRVLHGTSDSVAVVGATTPAGPCASDLVDGPTQVTAVRLPQAP